MNRAFASLATLAASAAFMFPLFSLSNQWCEGSSYSVVRPNRYDEPQALVFEEHARAQYCSVVSDYKALLAK